ncbi:MAG: hypothetical protein N4A49_06215 [Marinifilaceae bacterium]|jgi:hypothetical protein|nr:hypothetical protein [Marinifilaceae bacterium]
MGDNKKITIVNCILEEYFVIYKAKHHPLIYGAEIYGPSYRFSDFKIGNGFYQKIKASDYPNFYFIDDGYTDDSERSVYEYFRMRSEEFKENRILTFRKLRKRDIEKFYKVEIHIEIEGELFTAGKYRVMPPDDEDYLYIWTGKDSKLKEDKIVFGDRGINEKMKLFLKNRIDKVYAVKTFYEPGSAIEKYACDYLPTGEEETYTLDMNNFDYELYEKVFKAHKLLLIEGEEFEE